VIHVTFVHDRNDSILYMSKLLGKIVYTSNHGTSQGIVTRFFLQFEEMSKFAFMGDQERKKLHENYYNKNLNDFTDFYDIYQLILKLRRNYIEGIKSGLFYKAFENGEFTADKSPEVNIKKAIKDFFSAGKPLLNNFAKSKIIDDGNFELVKLLIKSPESFDKAKNEMLPNLKIKGYNVLFQIIEDAQTEFKKDFFLIRDAFEHNYLQIPNFEIKESNGVIFIEDPKLKGENVFKLIDFYYHKTLNLIEDLSAYFFGLNVCLRTNGNITLFSRKSGIDPSHSIYKYTLSINCNDPNLIQLIGL